jgi:hypothetical protein
MGTDMAREAAAVADDRRLCLWAKVMVARHALAAVHVTARIPADADALAESEALGAGADGGNPADDLVAEHCRELRDAPLVVQN